MRKTTPTVSGSVSSEGVVATNIGVMAFIDVVELLGVVVVVVVTTLLTVVGVVALSRHSRTGHA